MLLTLLISTLALAKPVYFSMIQAEFPHSKIKIRCQVCHKSGGPQLNPMGHDFASLKQEFGMGEIDTVWAKLRALDSDQDGLTNEQEILEGGHPGKP